jgi:hypothetical protein
MPLLQSPDILPEAMRFILRAVLSNEDPLPYEEARRLVAPATLGTEKDESAEDPSSGSNKSGRLIFERSLEGLKGLGLVSQTRGVDRLLTADSRVRERFPKWQQLSARSFSEFFIDEALFAPVDSSGPEQTNGGDDLAEVLAFSILVSSPVQGFKTFSGDTGRRFQDAQRDLLGVEREKWLVLNDERYRGMLRWLTYLGVARSFDSFLLIEPSSCLRRHVADIVTEEIPMDVLLDQLGERLPFTDRGTVGLRLRNKLSIEIPEREISPGLAMGLMILAESGAIRLLDRDDASNFGFRIDENAVSRFSHIALGSDR